MREYGYEMWQVDETLEPLQDALGIGSCLLQDAELSSDSNVITDIYVLADDGGPFTIIEYKGSLDTAEPQLAACFHRLAVNMRPSVFYGRRYPAFGVVIRGEL